MAAHAASYSFEELERGILLASAISAEQAAGNKVSHSAGLGGHIVQRSSDNKLVSILRSCGDRLSGYTTEALGGAVGFVKRVAQFNKAFGPGLLSASSHMASIGEVSSVKVVWAAGQGRSVTLEFTPETPAVAESQWLVYAVPTSCTK